METMTIIMILCTKYTSVSSIAETLTILCAPEAVWQKP